MDFEEAIMNRFQYPVLLTPAEEGGFVVTCRDLPQLITQGDIERLVAPPAGARGA